MICPHCKAGLAKLNAEGEPLVRNKGVVFKAEGVFLLCPRCTGDVPVTQDFAKALNARMLLVIKPSGKS